jgi:hypothetical protein
MLDSEIAMLKRLPLSSHVVHFIAYVVDEGNDLRGILLPWAGVTIDTLPTISWSYLRDVVCGLRDIHALPLSETVVGEKDELSHGVVFCRNILVMNIDLDSEGPDYPGAHKAILNILLNLKDKAEGDIDKSCLEDMETWLRDGLGFTELSAKMNNW